jgi:4-oxalocrotonate tautomerase
LSGEDPAYHSERCASPWPGNARTQKKEKLNMPLATIKVIEGVFSAAEKQQMIEKVAQAMISVEGEVLRDKTVVLMEEVKSGDWYAGGCTISTEDVKRLRAGQ